MRSLPGLGHHAVLAALTVVVSAGIIAAMAAPAAAGARTAADATPTGISFQTAPPLAAAVGTTYAVRTRGGGASTPVTLDTQDHAVCSVAKSVVTFEAAGVCFVEAHQDADATHADADAGQLIDVAPAAVPVVGRVLAPQITATVTSARAESSHGWYRTPVTVSFTCSPATNCPAPVSLTRNVAGQSVTRRVVAATGASASVTVGPLAIDRSAPTVAVGAVRAGARYHGAGPRARCRATDAVSGVVSCSLTSTRHGHVVTVRATATDRAGNVSRRVVSYRVHTR